MEIKEKGRPSGGLMFRYGSNDGDMFLSVSWIQEGIEPTRPRANIPGNLSYNRQRKSRDYDRRNCEFEEGIE